MAEGGVANQHRGVAVAFEVVGLAVQHHVPAERLDLVDHLPEESHIGGAAEVGYENPAFFRRLFKRATGLTHGQYRRMFRPLATTMGPAVADDDRLPTRSRAADCTLPSFRSRISLG